MSDINNTTMKQQLDSLKEKYNKFHRWFRTGIICLARFIELKKSLESNSPAPQPFCGCTGCADIFKFFKHMNCCDEEEISYLIAEMDKDLEIPVRVPGSPKKEEYFSQSPEYVSDLYLDEESDE